MNYFVYQSLLFTGLVLYTWRRTRRSDLSFRIAWNLAFLLMVFGFLGGRLFHVLYEQPALYRSAPLQILKFWEGGFVFYGGFLTALLAAAAYLHLERERLLTWGDFFAPVLAAGYAFGRLGCQLAGCCYGAYCDAPWAVNERHPAPLYAFGTEILLFLALTRIEKREPRAGLVFAVWLVGHALGRIFMESYRADFRGRALLGYSVSTWISVGVFAAGILLLLRITAGRKKSP